MPPDNKTTSSSTTTQNEVKFWSLHWNKVTSDPPHWNQLYFHHPHNNQVNFDATLNQTNLDANAKTISFSTRHIWRVIYTGTRSCDTAATSITWIRVPTRSVHTTIKPRKCCVSIYTMFYHLTTWCTHDYCAAGRWNSLRSDLLARSNSWCHI